MNVYMIFQKLPTIIFASLICTRRKVVGPQCVPRAKAKILSGNVCEGMAQHSSAELFASETVSSICSAKFH